MAAGDVVTAAPVGVVRAAAACVVAVVVGRLVWRAVAGVGVFSDALEGGVRRRLRGPILARYRAEGGPIGHLGRPISNEEAAGQGPARPMDADREVRFERGVIWLATRSRSTKVQYYNQMPGLPDA